MAASYPGAVKSFTTKVDLVDTVDADHVNDLQLEVTAIETELGVNPPDVDDSVNAVATAADLALRLDHIANIIKAISGAANWYTDPSTTVNQLETDVNAVEAAYLDKTVLAAKGDILGASGDDTAAITTVGGDNRMLRALASAGAGIAWDKRQYVQLVAFDFNDDTIVGDGKAYFHVPAHLAGLDLVETHAENITAGTTGTLNIQIRNVTQAGVNMLSTAITVDSAETGSDTAATPAVIDGANDDVAENDLIAIDIDGVHTTAAKGLIITLGFA